MAGAVFNNYETMKNKMAKEFVTYDQDRMIEKFDLKHDDSYIYIRFVGKDYRINRSTGEVHSSEDDFATEKEAGYNECMTIYDVLCYSKDDCRLAGSFCSIGGLKGTAVSTAKHGSFFQMAADAFAGKLDQLQAVLEALGEKNNLSGDVSVTVMVFDFMPITIQFWDADDEFSAELKYMVDENIQDFMHYETMMFMLSYVTEKIKRRMK